MNKRKKGIGTEGDGQKKAERGLRGKLLLALGVMVSGFTSGKSRLGIMVSAIVTLYLAIVFVRELSCSYGLLGCGMEGFGIIFPFYIFMAALMRHLTLLWFVVLYLAASVLYVYIAYLAGAWAERLIEDRTAWGKRKGMAVGEDT